MGEALLRIAAPILGWYTYVRTLIGVRPRGSFSLLLMIARDGGSDSGVHLYQALRQLLRATIRALLDHARTARSLSA